MYRVLLVDDEAFARTALRAAFDWEGSGFELVGEASNGRNALPWIERDEVDILITDIAMPVMDGLELMRAARERSPSLKIVLLSCHSDFEYVREGLRLGAADYLLKPTLEPDDLREVLAKVTAQIAEEREISVLRQAAQEAARQAAEQKPDDGAGEDYGLHRRLVANAVEYLKANYTQNISLQDVADHVAVSKNYFSELFKRITGQNFIDYVTELRLTHAGELLRSSTLKVYEIADLSGFKDVKYFSKVFKKVMKVSPADYREGRGPRAT